MHALPQQHIVTGRRFDVAYNFAVRAFSDTHGDGEWTMRIHNDRWNDIKVHQFRIVLEYK